ncbi:hypothetical protein QQX98_000939 [Neonectria punicea]|uniref:Uncharacterized protein n=1 Tax=Neonectria punicea TaxID=979145 RepID=A0ABR1HRZ6_9HYPO
MSKMTPGGANGRSLTRTAPSRHHDAVTQTLHAIARGVDLADALGEGETPSKETWPPMTDAEMEAVMKMLSGRVRINRRGPFRRLTRRAYKAKNGRELQVGMIAGSEQRNEERAAGLWPIMRHCRGMVQSLHAGDEEGQPTELPAEVVEPYRASIGKDDCGGVDEQSKVSRPASHETEDKRVREPTLSTSSSSLISTDFLSPDTARSTERQVKCLSCPGLQSDANFDAHAHALTEEDPLEELRASGKEGHNS